MAPEAGGRSEFILLGCVAQMYRLRYQRVHSWVIRWRRDNRFEAMAGARLQAFQ